MAGRLYAVGPVWDAESWSISPDAAPTSAPTPHTSARTSPMTKTGILPRCHRVRHALKFAPHTHRINCSKPHNESISNK